MTVLRIIPNLTAPDPAALGRIWAEVLGLAPVMDHGWIVTLAEVENVTDAAAMLGTTQPTLSRRLATLESALGASLFDRPGRRLRLNDAGRIYADAAKGMPIAYGVSLVLIVMFVLLAYADIVNPVKLGNLWWLPENGWS